MGNIPFGTEPFEQSFLIDIFINLRSWNMVNMSAPILKIQNLSKSFGTNDVLKNISLDINQGEIIGLIGASGAGKTTFLNTMIGFLKPDSGDVVFRLNHLLSYKDNYLYKSVFKNQRLIKQIYGFASQTPSFYEELSTKENLEYFGLLHNLNKETIKSNVATLLNLMNLEQAKGVKAKHLSGGMERRLDIACSLIHDPDILILDEPTADLDPLLRNHIWDLVRKINKKGTTIILSSHHLSELEHLCDRIVILKDSKILASGKPEELKKQFSIEKEIILQTASRNYEQLLRLLKRSRTILSTRVEKDTVRILTKNPEKSLTTILASIKELRDELTFINVTGASLDDMFISIWKDDKKR